ncbi:M91 family zinc metallopeptidase [Dysgonomonas reticulitermitis]
MNNVDLRGDSITTVINTAVVDANGNQTIQSDRYYYGQDANGNYGFIGANGQIYSRNNQFVNNLTTALADLRGGAKGQALVNDLMTSTSVVNIAQGGRNVAGQNGDYITWNPNSTMGGMNTMGNENRPSYIGLGHEMAHIQDTWKGTIDNSTWVTEGGVAIPNSEKYATHVENQLRSENNIPLRTHYGIDASSGTRVGLESTRIIRGGVSSFYMQSNGTVRGIPLLRTPYRY